MLVDFLTRVRELAGVALIRIGLRVAAFKPPLSSESETAFAGESPSDDEDDTPIPPVALSPAAQRMVAEAREATREPLPAPVARRGTVADRIAQARARAGG
jgi:hypothetical protein